MALKTQTKGIRGCLYAPEGKWSLLSWFRLFFTLIFPHDRAFWCSI